MLTVCWLTVCWVIQWCLWPESMRDESGLWGRQADWAAAQRQSVPRGWHDDDVFICTLVQNIPQSAHHFRDGVNADKGDVTLGCLLWPPVRWRTRMAIYGWILWLCPTPQSTLQLCRRNLFTDHGRITHWQQFPLSANYYNSSRYTASVDL